MFLFHCTPLFTLFVALALVAGPTSYTAATVIDVAHQGPLDASAAFHRDILDTTAHAHRRRSSHCKSKKASNAVKSDVVAASSSSSSSTSSSGGTRAHAVKKSKTKGKDGKSKSGSSGSSKSDSSKDSSSSSSSSSEDDSSSSSSSSSKNGTSASTTGGGSGPYKLVKSNRGDKFWDGSWNFWNKADPTNGKVRFVDHSTAQGSDLVGMKDGAAYMRASSKNLNGQNRPSVRFESKRAYDSGLIIFDVKKMPVGCGVWPALWTTQGANWPRGGEIDVVEGVGYEASNGRNQMTVHIGQNSPLEGGKSLGTPLAKNCNQYGEHTGCAFFDSNKNGPSWGTKFNAAGGGVWAMEFGSGHGVRIWFFGRKSGKIPKELSEPGNAPSKLNPDSWGTPMANFQASALNQVISKQNIIMDIT